MLTTMMTHQFSGHEINCPALLTTAIRAAGPGVPRYRIHRAAMRAPAPPPKQAPAGGAGSRAAPPQGGTTRPGTRSGGTCACSRRGCPGPQHTTSVFAWQACAAYAQQNQRRVILWRVCMQPVIGRSHLKVIPRPSTFEYLDPDMAITTKQNLCWQDNTSAQNTHG